VSLDSVVCTTAWLPRVGDDRRRLALHAGLVPLPGGHHALWSAEHPRRQRDRVGPEVEERAARQVGAHDPVLAREPLAVLGEHGPDLAQHAGVERCASREPTATTSCRLWMQHDEFDFACAFFTINAGFSEPKPLQVPRPPIMNAGGSGRGREYAAQYADMVFIHVQDDTDLSSAAAQVKLIKDLARDRYGREAAVWTQGYVVCRPTNRPGGSRRSESPPGHVRGALRVWGGRPPCSTHI
jgi:hypothetical protein